MTRSDHNIQTPGQQTRLQAYLASHQPVADYTLDAIKQDTRPALITAMAFGVTVVDVNRIRGDSNAP